MRYVPKTDFVDVLSAKEIMNSISIKTDISPSLLNYAELPDHDRYEIDERISRFQSEWGASPAPGNLSLYCENLAPHVSRILQRELMIEDYFLQHQKLDESLYDTYRKQIEPAMVETLFVERLSPDDTSTGTDAQPVPSIHGFEIQERIGKGGTAVVYKAIQLRFDRVVALKVPIRFEGDPDPKDRKRFYDEARLQAKYLGAGVPAVFACSFGDYGVPYIAMEYIEGKQLEEFFPKQQPDRKQCVDGFRLIAKVCRALEPLHRDQTLHLDLSAGNVYLDSQGNVKILDFGFGYARGLKPLDKLIAGTLDYMAPEKAVGARHFRPSTDVFSLGVFLARMATGHVIFPSGLTNDEKLQCLRDGSYSQYLTALDSAQRTSNLPQPLLDLARQCLSFDAEKRPADAGAVAELIQEFFKQEDEELQRLQIRTAQQKVAGRWLKAVVRVFAIGLLCSLGFGFWANIERQRAQRNMQMRIDALDTIVRVATGETLQKAGQTSVQKALLEPLIELVDEAAKSESSDASSLEQKALALNAMTAIHQSMQQSDQALQDATQAETILREICKSKSATQIAKLALAVSLGNQASLLGMNGQLNKAAIKAQEASQRLAELTVENTPHQVYVRRAIVENTWANCLKREAEMQAEAQGLPPNYLQPELHYRNALTHIKTALNMNPMDSQYRSWGVKILSNLALLTASKPEGLGHAREAVRLARQLSTDYPDDIASREGLAVALTNEGGILLEGADPNPSEAVAPLREALELYLALAAQVPMNTEFTWGSAMSHSNVADAIVATSSTAEDLQTAMQHLKDANAIYMGMQQMGGIGQELQLYINLNNKRIQDLTAKMEKATQ